MKQYILISLVLLVTACGKSSDESLQVIPENQVEQDLLYKWEKIRYSLDLKNFNELFSINANSTNFFKVSNKNSHHAFSFEKEIKEHEVIPYYYSLGCINKDQFIDLKLQKLDVEFDNINPILDLKMNKSFLIPSSKFDDLKINLYLENPLQKGKQLLESQMIKDLNIIEVSKTIERNKAFRFTENTCLTLEIESFTLKTADREIFYHKNMNLLKKKNELKQKTEEIKTTFLDTKESFSVDNFLPTNSLIIKGELSATPEVPSEFFILPARCRPVNFGPQPKSVCTCLGTRVYEMKDYDFNEAQISLEDNMENSYQADYSYQNYREYTVKYQNNLYPKFSFKSKRGILATETISYKPRKGAAICPETKIQEVELPVSLSIKGEMGLLRNSQ